LTNTLDGVKQPGWMHMLVGLLVVYQGLSKFLCSGILTKLDLVRNFNILLFVGNMKILNGSYWC